MNKRYNLYLDKTTNNVLDLISKELKLSRSAVVSLAIMTFESSNHYTDLTNAITQLNKNSSDVRKD